MGIPKKLRFLYRSLFRQRWLEQQVRVILVDLDQAMMSKDSERICNLRGSLVERLDELRSMQSRSLQREAERLYIHIPDLEWERGMFVDRYRSETSKSKLYYAVKEQKDKNREYHLRLAAVVIPAIVGIIGALTGLIAVWKKK